MERDTAMESERQIEEIAKHDYYAHVDADSKKTQTIQDHLFGTMRYAKANCPLKGFVHIAILIALMHDVGKLSKEFQAYMNDILTYGFKIRKQIIDHSSAGGWLIRKIIGKDNAAAVFLSTIIYAHHGFQDCVDMNSGETLYEKRDRANVDFLLIKKRFFEIGIISKDELTKLLSQAYKEVLDFCNRIASYLKDKQEGYGNYMFYLGMHERLMQSLLIDSDWSDTSDFYNGSPMADDKPGNNIQDVWDEALANYKKYVDALQAKSKSPLNTFRDEISDCCYVCAMESGALYRMSAPTGSGKTLAILRFALNHAKQSNKQRIFYIAPYTSILEQNANEIRYAVGKEEIVLEHHCNVIPEDDDDEVMYRRLSENWDCPIIATTAVQFMNTLFSSRKSSVRRMHRLCNSIIVFDEVQAIPLKQMELFNLGINFLTAFCNTTVVLSSATQPSMAKLQKNNLFPGCREIVGNYKKYSDVFKRVDIIDKTNLYPGGMQAEDLCEFARQQVDKSESVLIIVNTKACAKAVFKKLKELYGDKYEIFHLSTNMCPQNRMDELEKMKLYLKQQIPLICVSTQLIEAGVDVSFGCVIRSLAGVDSIIQAAGRCNRHKENGIGKVYIIKIAEEVENLKMLDDIRTAARAANDCLYYYSQNPEAYGNSIDNVEMLKLYYKILVENRSIQDCRYRITQYPSRQMDCNTTLDELLGNNGLGRNQFARTHGRIKEFLYLPMQAFRTAGDEFEAIEDHNKMPVIIPYDDTAVNAINTIEDIHSLDKDKRRAARILNRYTVSVSPGSLQQLGNAVHTSSTGLLILSIDFYDKKEGLAYTCLSGPYFF